jgi:predicted Zn-dependent protease
MEVEVYAAQKRWTDAERVLREVLKSMPSPTVVIALCKVLQEAEKRPEADRVTSQWIKEHPKDGAVPAYLAELATQRGDHNTAARIYRGILTEYPKDPLVLNNLAWTLGQLKDPTAVEYAETANSLAPNSPAILDTLGWILVENGKDTRGMELLTKASELAPGAHAIRLHLSQALLKSGQKDAARKQLEVLARMPENSAIRLEARKLLSSL